MSADRPARSTRRGQRGVASLMVILFLLTVIAAVLGTSLIMSSSDILDSSEQNNSVRALLLAEGGLERAYGRMALGTVCNTLFPDPAGALAVGGGTLTLVSADWDLTNPSWCRVQVAATVGRSTRTVVGWFAGGGGTITPSPSVFTVGSRPANTTLTLSYTVPAGSSILLIGVSVRNTQDNAAPAVTVRYGGTLVTLAASAFSANPWPPAQIWYMTNPPAGTANVSVSVNRDSEMVVGAMAFTGVQLSTGATAPFDVAPVTNAAPGRTASLTITPVTNGAWVFEVAAMDNNDVTTMTARPNRVSQWNTHSNGNVRGVASTIGPISPAVAQSPEWTWTAGNNAKWSQAAVALRPGGNAQLVRWTEVIQ
jgi:hypothetical protein